MEKEEQDREGKQTHWRGREELVNEIWLLEKRWSGGKIMKERGGAAVVQHSPSSHSDSPQCNNSCRKAFFTSILYSFYSLLVANIGKTSWSNLNHKTKGLSKPNPYCWEDPKATGNTLYLLLNPCGQVFTLSTLSYEIGVTSFDFGTIPSMIIFNAKTSTFLHVVLLAFSSNATLSSSFYSSIL